MKRWIRVQKKIKGAQGRPENYSIQVDALSCGVPGLFLNLDPNPETKGYCITHRGSGLRVGSWRFRYSKDATKVAKLLTKEMDVDWSIKDPHVLTKKHFGINAAYERIVLKHVPKKNRIHSPGKLG